MHRTLVDALQAAAQTERGIYLVESGERESFLSYHDLYAQALAVHHGLRQAGVQAGEELLFQFADLRSLIVTYWACLCGRIVPIPLEFGDQAAAIDKVFAVWRTLGTPWLASDSDKLAEKFGKRAAQNDLTEQWQQMQARLLAPLALATAEGAAPAEAVTPEDIAFIQYSSGSTGSPKGVTLSHRNLLTNIGDILQSVGHTAGDRFLTWKPITHDFGMIAFHLAPVVVAGDQVRINTDAFIWNPAIWFSMVHKHRAHILGSPNFGYRHFLKLFHRNRGPAPEWDLSCVKVILNGAEPISEELCNEFMETLRPFGMPRNAMTPGYGLAEGSLISSLCPVAEEQLRTISVDRRQLAIGKPLRLLPEGEANAAKFVDCGIPYPNTQIRITNAKRQPLAENQVGHIEIRGGSVTAGYYRNPAVSAELINAEGWLNTQDLGVLREGRLYVVGRVKEMIVIGGVNYFPHDIEQAILKGQGDNQLNKYIAVGLQDPTLGSEALLIFVYHKRSDGEFAPVAAAVRRSVQEAFGLTVAHVLPTQKIPKTTSGKVQRFRLLEEFLAGKFDEALAALGEERQLGRTAGTAQVSSAATAESATLEASAVVARTGAVAARLLGVAQVDLDSSFFDLGLSSLRLVQLKGELEDEFGLLLDSTSPLDFPTVRALAGHIAERLQPQPAAAPLERLPAVPAGDEVAVVAVACRFPGGVESAQGYWDLLAAGLDPVAELPADRWQGDPQLGHPLTTRQGGFLNGVEQFDPLFFGISPAEAISLDPQQRLLLEVSHEALENAGWDPQGLHGRRIGVFIGISASEYAAVGRDLGHPTGPYTFTGTMFNAAAGRIAYSFGLQGPCVAVDSACSSSLVAVLQGVRELRAGSCEAVLAGGVNLILRSDGHISFSELNALSPSGRCRSFDDSADGYIRSEGCGMVLLKPLAAAERDGDPILAVIKGGAINHNGRSGGLTVPSGPAQEQLIRAALDDAGLRPAEIDYIEAHGSGTRLGDPQELTALAHLFSGRPEPLRIGSVKTNLGHLESGAGIAGLIKVVLMLQRQQLLPNLHFQRGNSLLDWSSLPLRVVTAAGPWPSGEQQRRSAGVSSFGISGTNAHVVLSEYRPSELAEAAAPRSGPFLFTLSARSGAGLSATVAAYAARADLDQADFARLCATANRSRSGHPWRFAANAADLPALRRQLERWLAAEEVAPPADEALRRHTVFLFTGQGSVYPHIGRRLYLEAPAFRAAFDACDALFAPRIGHSLRACVVAGDGSELHTARLSQALIFSVEYALAALWRAFGIEPTIVLGHSIGEYAAAATAGVVTLEDAVAMVALRGTLMDETPADGAMAGLLGEEAQVRALVAAQPGSYIAAINTDANLTVSGEAAAIGQLLAAARKARIFPEPLPMRHPFHSPLMAAGAERLAEGLRTIRFHDPRITFISCQSGTILSQAEQLGADYWSAHLCQPVLFRDALRQALALGATTFVELGGSAALAGLGAQIASADEFAFLPSLREGKDEWEQINQSLAALYRRGYRIDWEGYHGPRRPLLAQLPNTAYQRAPYWFAQQALAAQPLAARPLTIEALTPPAVPAEAPLASAPVVDLAAAVVLDVCEAVARVTGLEAEQVSAESHIFELGIDSLMLMQLDKHVVKRYAVDIPVKQFFAELDTPARIAAYICAELPAERRAALTPVAASPMVSAAPLPVEGSGQGSGLEAIVASQLEIMRQQLALLRGEAAPAAVALTALARSAPPLSRPPTEGKNELRGMTLHHEDVDGRQLAYIRDLVARVVAKTPQSKAYTQRYRRVFADWIATLNYSLDLKEMAYPVVAARSRGGRFWDIDGNEYIDTATGYGATFFGHNPDFIVEAIRTQLDEGMELGPQSDLAGEVAELICRLTGAERAAFCNSGTEAVMVALRLARAVTRRPKIVRFSNSYHGSFDGVLAEAGDEGSLPVAAGIIESMIADTVVVPYNSAAALDTIRALGDQLAAVLVEPVQSRAPTAHSRDYLLALRQLTEELGACLIFDEMITGFRIHPAGVQGYYGIRADLATYGKVVGGGMPIGVVAGRAHFMDAIDGGHWEFGDDSGPLRETTFFAGTFCKHPLAMAAARAVLRRLAQEGEQLMAQVNALTERFCERANALFASEEIPIEAQRFGSLYRFETKLSQDPARSSLEMNLLFREMQLQGVYVWERRTSFFCLAHTDADVDRILAAVRHGCAALRQGGFSLRSAQRATAVPALPAPGSLSSEERRMYVLSLMRGGEYAYHVTGALRLRGPLDSQRCRQALASLAERHPILRASYAYAGDSVVRRIAATIELPLVQLAQATRPLAEQLSDFIQPFDLARAPLWRAALIETGSEEERVLALDLHHLIADGISVSILIEEFSRLYGGEPLPPVGADYSEFVRWEQAYHASSDYGRERDYWLARLQPPPPPLALPTDLPRPAQNDFAGGSLHFVLDESLQRGVRELARRQRVTPFMVLLSAYYLLLAKLTQQGDLCIGTPFDRRANGQFDQTVGMFAQTLLIRAQVDSAAPFQQLLAQVRDACMEAYAQPNCSLDELVGQLQIARDFSRNPLFDTMFIFENGDRRVYQSGPLSIDTLPVPSKGSAFDLTLEITEQQGRLNGHFIYASRLFQATTIGRWARHFEQLLRGLLAAPQQPVGQLSLLDETERTLLIDGLNHTERPLPAGETLVSLWRAQVAASGEQSALIFGDQRLSYQALAQQVDAVAAHLYALGVRRGQRVGILLPRGPGLIAALLGSLAVGAAYVPLDPDYPAARIGYMLERSGVAALLTRAPLAAQVGFTGRQLDPDALPATTPSVSPEAPTPDDLAYIIFTSGSTGQPKGVMIEHASVVNFLYGMGDALALPERPVVLGLTTISFDIFVLELFLTLARGGCLVLADETAQRDPAALVQLIRQQQVNVMQATPSRIQALLATHAAPSVFGGLALLLVGGEAFPRALLEPLQGLSGLRLYNVYGPTETTVWSAVKELTQARAVTLGRPIANTRCYVLDGDLQPLPVGCTGDLWIAGAGLARGYLDDPERSAAAFRADPFQPAGRIYRTGDRVAWNEAGELIYHGRGDGQIKLRGYRIEIQEIEAVLQRHPAVALAAVAVRELSAGNPVLVAYCALRPDAPSELRAAEPLTAALRSHAAAALPDYMVPAVVVAVAELPLTPNGKIDRLQLPALSAAALPPAAAREEASDALEAEIVGVWQRILGERPIGIHDSFFDVGGNSFSLVSMHAALCEHYPGVLEVADIFANPTVAALKARISAALGGEAEEMPQALPFPAAFIQHGGPARAETLSAELDGDSSRLLAAAAEQFGVEPMELAVAIYALYLNKLLGSPLLEMAVGFSPRPEYVLLELDFAAVRGLRELAAAVREEHHTGLWSARRLTPRTTPLSRSADGIRPLLLLTAAAERERYGFDLVLRAQLTERLLLRVEYDGGRLSQGGAKQFVANYLKLIKALVSHTGVTQ